MDLTLRGAFRLRLELFYILQWGISVYYGFDGDDSDDEEDGVDGDDASCCCCDYECCDLRWNLGSLGHIHPLNICDNKHCI